MLERIADLDRQSFFAVEDLDFDESGLKQREALVCELGQLCRLDVDAGIACLAEIEAMLERTIQFEQRILVRRGEIAQALRAAETELRQLRSFGEPAAADATLLNRLA